MRTRFIYALCAVSLATHVPCHAEAPKPVDAATLESYLDIYSHTNVNNHREEIIACGQRATDAIMKAIEKVYWSTGRTRVGARPKATPSRMFGSSSMLRLLHRLDAPVPVDALCRLIEKGLGNRRGYDDTLDTALSVLAGSGHPQGLAYIKRHRELAEKSRSKYDRSWCLLLRSFEGRWQAANEFITTGKVPEGRTIPVVSSGKLEEKPYKPSVSTMAMRRQFEADPNCLKWNGKLDADRLAASFAEYAPLLRDKTKSIQTDYGCFGRWYEAILAPMMLAWLEGDVAALEDAFGGPVPAPNQTPVTRTGQVFFLGSLASTMTGQTALEVKKKVIEQDQIHSHASSLEHHDPSLWSGDALALASKNGLMVPTVLTSLGKAERELTPKELEALPGLLARPKLRFPDGSEEALAQLARKAPDAFKAALKQQHLSCGIVDAALRAKLTDDVPLILSRIEHGMYNDYAPDFSRIPPERLAKLPAHIRERIEERMKSAPTAPRRINTEWLAIIRTHLWHNPDALSSLKRLDADDRFDRGRGPIKECIAQMQAAHPEWKDAEPEE